MHKYQKKKTESPDVKKTNKINTNQTAICCANERKFFIVYFYIVKLVKTEDTKIYYQYAIILN